MLILAYEVIIMQVTFINFIYFTFFLTFSQLCKEVVVQQLLINFIYPIHSDVVIVASFKKINN